MLLKKIIGLIIIMLNAAGIGFIIYMVVAGLQDKFSDEIPSATKAPLAGNSSSPKTSPKIKNDNIIPDEDDLLKDMDLSDLDNINLDDFD